MSNSDDYNNDNFDGDKEGRISEETEFQDRSASIDILEGGDVNVNAEEKSTSKDSLSEGEDSISPADADAVRAVLLEAINSLNIPGVASTCKSTLNARKRQIDSVEDAEISKIDFGGIKLPWITKKAKSSASDSEVGSSTSADVALRVPKSTNDIDKNTDGNGTTSQPSDRSMICAVCKNLGTFACSGCLKVTYCSEEHQHEDWKRHETTCGHFRLVRSPLLISRGPFHVTEEKEKSTFRLTAATKVSKGTTIMEEKPFLVSPWPRTALRKSEQAEFRLMRGSIAVRCLTCFGCCKYLNFDSVTCGMCTLPMCSKNCKQAGYHLNGECQFVQKVLETGPKNRFKVASLMTADNNNSVTLLYTDVMIVRLFLKLSSIRKQQGNKVADEFWNNLWITWKIKEIERSTTSKYGSFLYANLEKYFPISWLATKGDCSLLWKLYCVIESNSFRFDLAFRRFNVLCTVLNHVENSCKPNSHAYIQEPEVHFDDKYDKNNDEPLLCDLTVVLRAGVDLLQGDPITFPYAPLVLNTRDRRQYLFKSYLLWCECQRCNDPTECGTHLSSITCNQCATKGRLVPSTELLNEDYNSKYDVDYGQVVWSCEACLTTLSNSSSAVQQKASFTATGESAFPTHVIHRLEVESMSIAGEHQLVEGFLNEFRGPGRVKSRTIPIILSDSHYVFMKLYDDILRGALYPLADLNHESLEEFKLHMFVLLRDVKTAYATTMKRLNPGFQFEGFPLRSIDMMINESYLREFEIQTSRLEECDRRNQSQKSAVRCRRHQHPIMVPIARRCTSFFTESPVSPPPNVTESNSYSQPTAHRCRLRARRNAFLGEEQLAALFREPEAINAADILDFDNI